MEARTGNRYMRYISVYSRWCQEAEVAPGSLALCHLQLLRKGGNGWVGQQGNLTGQSHLLGAVEAADKRRLPQLSSERCAQGRIPREASLRSHMVCKPGR